MMILGTEQINLVGENADSWLLKESGQGQIIHDENIPRTVAWAVKPSHMETSTDGMDQGVAIEGDLVIPHAGVGNRSGPYDRRHRWRVCSFGNGMDGQRVFGVVNNLSSNLPFTKLSMKRMAGQ
jgi:hypothetical protein